VRYSAVLPTIDSQLETLKATIGDAAQGLIASLEYGVQPVGLRSKVGNPAASAFDTAMQRMIFNDGTTEQILNDAVEEVAEKLAE
jgi:multiple sugar transport system substrate-binding protein